MMSSSPLASHGSATSSRDRSCADRKSVGPAMTGVQTCALPIYDVSRMTANRLDPRQAVHDELIAAGEPWLGDVEQGQILRRSEERRAGNDWSSDVCSSDL